MIKQEVVGMVAADNERELPLESDILLILILFKRFGGRLIFFLFKAHQHANARLDNSGASPQDMNTSKCADILWNWLPKCGEGGGKKPGDTHQALKCNAHILIWESSHRWLNV